MRVRPDGLLDLAAIVVNYNAAAYLPSCLASLLAEGVAQLVVVDNGSTDESRALVGSSPARWVDSGSNLGYGAAANLAASGIAADSAAYLLICNPDIEIRPGAIRRLAERMEASPGLGAVGPRICNPDGSLYPSARTFPDLIDAMGHGLLGQVAPQNRFTRRYRLLDWDHGQSADVDWISGACFLIRREAWDAVDGFDPGFFMYMEDVDLCWRLRERGWNVGYEPRAEVMHVQGVSAGRHPYRMLSAHHLSMWRFAWRTTKGPRRAALPLVAVGLAGRLAVASVQHRFVGSVGGAASGPLP